MIREKAKKDLLDDITKKIEISQEYLNQWLATNYNNWRLYKYGTTLDTSSYILDEYERKRSNLRPNKIRSIVLAIVSSYLDLFFTTPQFFHLFPTKNELLTQVLKDEKILNKVIRHIRYIRRKMTKVFLQQNIFGWSVMKVHKGSKKQPLLWDFCYIDNILFDPTANFPDEIEYLIQKEYKSEDEIRDTYSKYRKEEVEKFLKASKKSIEESFKSERSKQIPGRAYENKHQIGEVWTPSEITVVGLINGEAKYLLREPRDNPYKEIPYIFFVDEPDLYSCAGYGVAERCQHFQEELQTLRNMKLDIIKYSIYHQLMVQPDLLYDPSQLTVLSNPAPGIPVLVKDYEAVRELATSPIASPDFLTSSAEISQDIEDTEAWYDVNLGRAPEHKETASGLIMRHTSAERRQGSRLNLLKESLEEAGRLSLLTLKWMEDGIGIPNKETGTIEEVKMSPEAYEGYEISTVLSSDAYGFADIEKNQLLQFLTVLTQTPAANTVDWQALISLIAQKGFRIEEAEEIFKSNTPMKQALMNMPEKLVAEIMQAGLSVLGAQGQGQQGQQGQPQSVQPLTTLSQSPAEVREPGVRAGENILHDIYGGVYR